METLPPSKGGVPALGWFIDSIKNYWQYQILWIEIQESANVLTAFDDLDNPEDIALFEEYLIKNLALYFEKWEGELQNNVEPPAAAADAEPDEPLDAAGGEGDLVSDEEDSEEETEVPEFELEEVLNFFDLDDIIKHIL